MNVILILLSFIRATKINKQLFSNSVALLPNTSKCLNLPKIHSNLRYCKSLGQNKTQKLSLSRQNNQKRRVKDLSKMLVSANTHISILPACHLLQIAMSLSLLTLLFIRSRTQKYSK